MIKGEIPGGIRQSEFVSLGVIGALTLLALGLLHHDLSGRLPYPPHSDQRMYLAGASYFARHFLFFWRSPLYGAWMGAFYLVSGCDLQLCFYLEKFASLAVLSISVAYLGYRLFDIPSALMMCIWTLNCKYVVLETNGSHALAAALFALSLSALLVRNREVRVPTSLLLLFLTTQVRSEMWVPFLAIVAYLAVRSLRRRRNGEAPKQEVATREHLCWIFCIVVGLGLFLLFIARPSAKEPHRLSEAFAMNFALNYIDRHNLNAKEDPAALEWRSIWIKALPGVSKSADAIERDRGEIHPLTAVRKYPGEMMSHVAYNMRLALTAFPAVFLAFDRPGLMLILFPGYLLFFAFSNVRDDGSARWNSLPDEYRRLFLVWSTTIFLLVPISFALRVVARYYIQLIPIQIAAAILMMRVASNKIRIPRSR
jgi:hypothetical protein